MMPVHQFPESDCKPSPLALLVQICSNIGAEKPTKSSDKNGNSGSNNSNSSSSSNSSSDEIRVTKDSKDVVSCSPATSVHSTSSLTSSTNRTSKGDDTFAGSSNSKRNTPSECRSSPMMGRASVERRTTPGSAVHSPDSGGHHRPKSGGEKTPTSSASSAATSSHDNHPSTTSSTGASSSASDPTYSSSSALGLDFSRDSGSLLGSKEGASTSSLGGLGSYKAGLNGLNPLALANCSGCSPVAGHIPLDAAATYPLAGALKSGYSFGSALTPYMNYARMKSAAAAGGAASFVPVCRDPYCTNCQLAAQLPYQDRLAAHMSGLYPGALPGYPVPGFASPSASSAFGSSVLPPGNVCSWIMGNSCCGKRFASPEELFQHLRTHSSLPSSPGSLPLYSPGVSLPSALSMEACGLYSTPSLTTPAGLRRTYPTSLSPVSSLSAAGRYHPYKPPGMSPLSSAPLPPLGHPGLGFYNPYSGVYGKG